jgi:hypothetical protein
MESQNINVCTNSYPKTTEQWWDWAEHEWKNVLSIIHQNVETTDLIETIQALKESRDPKIKQFLEDCWTNIPENEYTENTPGWCVFSILMSDIDLLEKHITPIELFKQRYHHFINIGKIKQEKRWQTSWEYL